MKQEPFGPLVPMLSFKSWFLSTPCWLPVSIIMLVLLFLLRLRRRRFLLLVNAKHCCVDDRDSFVSISFLFEQLFLDWISSFSVCCSDIGPLLQLFLLRRPILSLCGEMVRARVRGRKTTEDLKEEMVRKRMPSCLCAEKSNECRILEVLKFSNQHPQSF